MAGDEEGPVVVAVAGVPQEREVGALEVEGAADDAGAGREAGRWRRSASLGHLIE